MGERSQPVVTAAELEAHLPGVLAELCLALAEEGRHTAAERIFEGLAELCPGQPATTLLEGMLACASQRYRHAERCYWKVLTAQPGHLEARAFLAESLILQRRTGEARRVLAGLARVRGDHPALAFAASLKKGFEVGLYGRLSAAS